MGVTDRVWGALVSVIKLEDKVSQQSAAMKSQQAKIENLTERVIRLETMLEIALSVRGTTLPPPPLPPALNKPKPHRD
jgi:uncharacterized coiled-coil protein SlyX